MNRILLHFRERVNLSIYRSKDAVLRILRTVSFFASLLAIGTLVYYYGFSQNKETEELQLIIIKGVFIFYVINYFTRFFFSFEPLNFLLSTWFEGLLMLLLVYDGISLYFFNVPILEIIFQRLGFETFTNFYILFIQLYMLLVVGIDLTKTSTFISKVNLKPATTFIFSFILLILFGVSLLMMPEMTTIEGSMSFIDALFTSTSAVCVTGLTVVDTATYFTFKGQLLILILIQLGGIGIISFAAFFATFLKEGIGLKQQTIIQDLLSEKSLLNTKSLLRQIIYYTFLIETIGAVVIYSLWSPKIEFNSLGEKIFVSIFHSIAAFCNAGFSTFTDNLMDENVKNSYVIHLSIAVLIILGGLGFSAINDLFGIKHLRERLQQPWKQWQLSTKIAVYTSAGLVLFGGLLFFVLEQENTLSGMKPVEAVITSLFQSVTTRTAGFNTLDIGLLGTPILIILIILMFIGASSGSTGGGIKTSTFFLMLYSAYATLRGEKKIEVGKKHISFDLLYKAFTILFFASSFVITGTIVLSITEPDINILQLVFEEVSAFATVGLSTGITENLSYAGKIVIIITMFIGRISTLTLFFSLSIPAKRFAHHYPEAHIMVG